MENLVVSVFNTESEAYQSFADLKAFRQTQTTKVAQIALVKNENGHIVEKERYDFEDSTTDATLEVACSVQLSGFWVVLSASCLVMVLAASMVWLLVIPLIRQKLA